MRIFKERQKNRRIEKNMTDKKLVRLPIDENEIEDIEDYRITGCR